MPRSRDSRTSSSEPTLLLAGETSQLGAVEQALSGLDARVIRAPWTRVLVEPRYESVIAVIIVPPVRQVGVLRALRQFRAAGEREAIPVFVLVSSEVPDRRTRELYRAGATAVLKWPAEASLISPMLAELLGISLTSGPARSVDAKLARTIRARLRLLGGSGTGMSIDVRGATARISGSLPSLEEKDEVDRAVAEIPGIKATDLSNLRVSPPEPVPDRQLGRVARVLIQATPQTDQTRVRAVVRNGCVELTGTVSSRRELNRYLDLLSRVRGVRGIEPDVTVLSALSTPDPVLERRLRARLKAALPRTELDVSVASGTVVLDGSVPKLSTRRDAERLVSEDRAVARIVNKIQVE